MPYIMYSAGLQKKCIEDSADEDAIAIAHDDDIQHINSDGAVSSSRNHFISEVSK